MSSRDWNDSVSGRADAAVLAALPGPLAVVLGESIPRAFASLDAITLLANGRMSLTSVPLQKGVPVSGITWFSDAVAMSGQLVWWFALYQASSLGGGPSNLCRQTGPQHAGGWAANTAKAINLTSPYTPLYTGPHWAAVMVGATQPPTLTAMAQPAHVAAVSPARNLATTSTALAVDAAPDPCPATSVQTNVPYCYIT